MTKLDEALGLFPSVIKCGEQWSSTCQAVLEAAKAELAKLRAGPAATPGWQPIETAPVPAWDSPEARPSYFTWRCLLQLRINSPGAEPWVTTGEAYYVAAPRSTERRILRWRDGHGRQCFPEYWMPSPAPKIFSLTPESKRC